MNWFLIGAVAVLLLLFCFLGFRITGMGMYSWVIAAIIVGLILFYPLVWYDVMPEGLNRIVRSIIHFDMGILSLLIAQIVIRDLVFLPIKIFKPEISNYAFSKSSTITFFVIFVISLIIAHVNALRGPEVLRVEVPIKDLPKDLEGYSIIQISDLHAGAGIDRKYVENVVEKINNLEADVVVMTGDIADGNFEKYKDNVEPLSKLSKKRPVIYITGNHEFILDSGIWINYFQQLGAKVLLNQHTLITKGASRILFAGVIDPEVKEVDQNKGPDIGESLAGSPKTDIKILLAHQPNIAESASKHFDLQLSGHTHGGQFFPWNKVIKLLQPYASGLKKSGDMWVYTNSGTGFWGPPFRLGTRSEITILKLKRI